MTFPPPGTPDNDSGAGQQSPQQDPTQQYPAQQDPTQQYPAQQYPEQQYPAQQYPAQQYPAQQYPPQPPAEQWYAAPGAPYGHGMMQPTAPVKKKKTWILWTSLGVALALVFSVMAVGLVQIAQVMHLFDRKPTAVVEDSSTIRGADLRDFDKAFDTVMELSDNYSMLSKDDAVALFGGEAQYDEVYFYAFLHEIVGLLDRSSEVRNKKGTPQELAPEELTIQEIIADAEALENAFLNKEQLATTYVIESQGGSSFTYDGVYVAVGTDSYNKEREAFARSFVPTMDGNGSYQASVEEFAAGFGFEIVYGLQKSEEFCEPTTSSRALVAATYCQLTPGKLYFNTEFERYDSMFFQLDVFDTVKHEMSHDRIFAICRTPEPPVATSGVHVEATTNSYSHLFLGASPVGTADVHIEAPEYAMSEASNIAAKSISAGNCG